MRAHSSSDNHTERVVTGDSPADWEDALSGETRPGRDTTQDVIGDTGEVINVFNMQYCAKRNGNTPENWITSQQC